MWLAGMVLLCAALPARRTSAQDMEPRAYSASPVGLNFLGIGYGWLTGSVILDPTLPISDIRATAQGPRVGIGHTFNLLGDVGLVTAIVPYAVARVTGNVFEQGAEARRSGLSDALFKLSVNLIGNPAISPREFMTAPPRHTIVGVSITVAAPVGQVRRYEADQSRHQPLVVQARDGHSQCRRAGGIWTPLAACGSSPRTGTSSLAVLRALRILC